MMGQKLQARIAIGVMYTTTFGIVACALWTAYGFPLDDSYIYQAIARAYASGGAAKAYLFSGPLAGATSPLWVLIQALHFRVLPSLDPVAFNLVLGWILFVLLGQLIWQTVESDQAPEVERWILAVSPALCGNLVWLGLIGMEHLLFLVLSLLAINIWYSRRNYAGLYAGVVAGLLVLVRPEAGLLGLYLVSARNQRRDVSDRWKFGLIWAFFIGLLISFNLRTTGSIEPSTLRGRSWLYFHSSSPHAFKSMAGFFDQWMKKLPQLLSIHFVSTTFRLTRSNIVFTVIALLLTVCVVLGAANLFQQAGERARAFGIWTLLHCSAFFVLMPASGQGGRYQPELLLLAFPALFSGMLWILRRAVKPPAVQRPILIFSMAVLGFSSLKTWRTVSIVSIGHIQRTHGAMANWILANLPTSSRIASFDSGDIAYSLKRPIVDLGGLADPSLVTYLEQDRVSYYLNDRDVTYVVLPHQDQARDNFHFLDLSHATLLTRFCSSNEEWQVSFSYTRNAWRCQELYHLALASRSEHADPKMTR